MKHIKEIAFFIVIIIAVIFGIACPLQALDPLAHKIMAATFITVAAWILRPWNLPCSVGGMILLGSAILFGLKPAVVFSGFTQPAIWTLIPALFFGLALQKTGLGKRIAMTIFRLLPTSWLSIIIAWTLIGLVLSLVTPSMTVRVSIMLPIALNCCKIYKLEKQSKEASFILIYAILMALVPGNAWLTGGLTAPIIQGVFDSVPELAGIINFQTWLQASLLPIMLTTVLIPVFQFLLLRPKQKLHISEDSMQMEPASKHEKLTGVILVILCILFFTGRWHGISNTTICLFAVVVLFATGILAPKEFSVGINWDLIIFFGSGLCMSQIFTETGISAWISEQFSPFFLKLSVHPIAFVPIIVVLLFLWRFIDVTTLMPTMVFLSPIIVTLAAGSSIQPMVWATLFALISCSMFLTYTNMWTYMGRQMSEPYQWTESHMFRAGTAFFLASMVGVIITIPYWIHIHIL